MSIIKFGYNFDFYYDNNSCQVPIKGLKIIIFGML